MGALIFIANYGHNKELIKRIDKDNLEKLVPQGHKVIIVKCNSPSFIIFLLSQAQARYGEKGDSQTLARALWNCA